MNKKKATSGVKAMIANIGIVRILGLTLIAAVGSWLSFSLALSGIMRNKNPAVALKFVPGESNALAARADHMYFADTKNPPTGGRALAVDAIRQQAINARALRVLGYYEEAIGEKKAVESLIRESAHLSRREPGAQLWLIDASVRQGNPQEALSHYDILLRTKPSSQNILFDRLIAAIEFPQIRSGLKPYFRSQATWPVQFLAYATTNSKNLPALVDLLIATGGLNDSPIVREQYRVLLLNLADKGHYFDVRRFYLGLLKADAALLTDPRFTTADVNGKYGPVGWTLGTEADAGGGFSQRSKDASPVMTVFADTSATRRVATRLLFLKPGAYTFAATLADVHTGEGGFIRWDMLCPTKQTQASIWTKDSVADGAISARIQISADCPVQQLNLIVAGGSAKTGTEATITSVKLTASQ